MFLAVILVGCTVYDAEVCPVAEEEPVFVTLHISVPGGRSSRAAYDAEYGDRPFGNEYYIYPSDVRVVVFDTDGSYKDHSRAAFVTETDSYHLYLLTVRLGKFSADDLGKDYKVVVLANLNGVTKVPFPSDEVLAGLTEEELYARLQSNFSNCHALTSAVINEEYSGLIPMWGSRTMEIGANTVADTPVDLMRAFAKVQISLSDALLGEGYYLDDVRLVKSRGFAWITPYGAHNAGDTEATYEPGQNYTTPNINVNDYNTNASFYKYGNDCYAYIPEQDANAAFSEDAQRMLVTVKNGTTGKAFSLFFAEYPDGGGTPENAFPVRRNCHYHYTITDVLSFDYTIRYEVSQWDGAVVDIPSFQ